MRHTLDSTLESVDRVEYLTLELAEQAGFPDTSLERIVLAVHETAANAVIHGNSRRCPGTMAAASIFLAPSWTNTPCSSEIREAQKLP